MLKQSGELMWFAWIQTCRLGGRKNCPLVEGINVGILWGKHTSSANNLRYCRGRGDSFCFYFKRTERIPEFSLAFYRVSFCTRTFKRKEQTRSDFNNELVAYAHTRRDKALIIVFVTENTGRNWFLSKLGFITSRSNSQLQRQWYRTGSIFPVYYFKSWD